MNSNSENKPSTTDLLPIGKQSSRPAPRFRAALMVSAVAAALIIGAGGFIGGIGYQKARAGVQTAAGMSASGPANGFGGRPMNGGFGTVTAVSSDSISVQSQRQSTPKTYAISSSTTVTDNGTTKSISDITVGNVVLVRTSDNTSTAATSIQLNPAMGRGGPPADSEVREQTTTDGQSI